jgi:hypothetical protein
MTRGNNGGVGLGFSRENDDVTRPYVITVLVPEGAAARSDLLTGKGCAGGCGWREEGGWVSGLEQLHTHARSYSLISGLCK